MTFHIHELRRAQADITNIAHWLVERSTQGAKAWLDAYDEMVGRLKHQADSCGAAMEHESFDLDIRQSLFKTRRGRVYRALFLIEGPDVYILRIRGPGQAPVEPDQLGI
ncbi:MAG: type II toxin-antitoxin system RelE/ParE family toxin [Thermoguttaceae bacterium]|jgi:plasmid stabilization system protein ParE|nr:type II toxin-antitoxin system RelE/ParE family toxin [Thermoguttaceae bacterium]